MSSESPIEHVFEHLNRWRHLPAYRLEPRADIFFALYLPEVLGKHFGVEINPLLVPEFPIKKKEDSASYKADYLALQEGDPIERAFLVELKTDMASRREDQDEYLRHAVSTGLQELILGIVDICRATDQKRKYVHLLKLLSDLRLIEYEDSIFPVKQGKYSNALGKIEDRVRKQDDWPPLEVVYVQPRTDIIDFRKFAETIEQRGADGVRQTFACYLRKWADEVAGEPEP